MAILFELVNLSGERVYQRLLLLHGLLQQFVLLPQQFDFVLQLIGL
jgi:hypothetical protein